MNKEKIWQFKMSITTGLISGMIVFLFSTALQLYKSEPISLILSMFVVIGAFIILLWFGSKMLSKEANKQKR